MNSEPVSIDVTSDKYRGYNYKISLCNPKVDWGDKKGMFTSDCSVIDRRYYKTLKETESGIKKAIDEFLDDNPSSWKEWYELAEECMIWSGYEDCELNSQMLESVMNRYANFINKKGSNNEQ